MEVSEDWYAVKVFSAKSDLLKYLRSNNIDFFLPMLDGKLLLASLLFVCCSESVLARLMGDWFQKIMVYQDAERSKPQSIPTAEMDNFRMVLSIRNQEFIPLEIRDNSFLAGQKVRVIEGPLKGAIGVIKRIKGDRRLVVSVTGVTAIATSYIRPDWLEAADQQPCNERI